MPDSSMPDSSIKTEQFDVVVIGVGPAGYVAAIRCSQLGLKTACVDKWVNEKNEFRAGGTCLNVGCIPSKALLESSEHYQNLQHEFKKHGIIVEDHRIDIPTMMAHKKNVVNKLTKGINQLLAANKVKLIQGVGQLISNDTVAVLQTHLDKEPKLHLKGTHIILAPGSSALHIPVAKIDNDSIVDSTGALSFDKVPETFAIIGAGVIGLELGSVWSRLGSKVTLLEAQDEFLSMADSAISKIAFRQFKSSNFSIKLGARVISSKIIEKDGKKQVEISYEEKGKEKSLLVDKLLVAVGRTPNTKQLFSSGVDLNLDECGFIDVDAYCRCNIPNIYAIGDAVRGPMLAHKGSEEGIAVAENIALNQVEAAINLDCIPSVIYTSPEIAWVGKTEQTLKSQGIDYKVGVFPFSANGRATASGIAVGQVKMLSDNKTDRILGVHIIGEHASELIAQAVIAMEFEASTEDLARIIFAHPTLSEAVHEAALACDKRAIHAL